MKYQKGDKLYCRQTFAGSDYHFMDGEWYEIEDITSPRFSDFTVWLYDHIDGSLIMYVHPEELEHYFLTEKEVRKLKLKEISNNIKQ